MSVHFKLCLSFLGMLFFISSCVTAEKYNEKRKQAISVSKLQKDIDYVQRNLYTRHPDYDYYTPKSVLDFKFDSLRKAINQPMTSNEFYPIIAKVIASVHQGHMATLPAPRRMNRERKKYLKTMGASPYTQFDYKWENQKMYVIQNKSIDTSIKKGWVLLSINDLTVKDIYQKYFQTLSSDGYNQTALPSFFAKRVPVFYNEELGILDSLNYVFEDAKGEQHKKVIMREPKVKKEGNTNTVDSALAVEKPIDNTADTSSVKAKPSKEALKLIAKNKRIYGYDNGKKEYIRQLKFYNQDSSIAYLKIAQFSGGVFKKAYKEVFDSISHTQSQVLVLDLRDNPGGRAMEVTELYKYFADSSFKFYAPSKVASKTALLNAGFYSRMPKGIWPFFSIYYPVYAIHRFVNTKKHKDGNYYYAGMGGHKWKQAYPNAFKGKVYLLINGGSFSAACLMASRLSVLPNVTIVGEETGGDFNGTVAGIMPILNLPNSNIVWRLGLMHVRPLNRTEVKGRGIFPEVPIEQTVKDIIEGKDSVLDWVLSQESSKEL